MEMETVEGSEITQIGMNEAFGNSMDIDKFSEDIHSQFFMLINILVNNKQW